MTEQLTGIGMPLNHWLFFAGFSPDAAPDPDAEAEFFAKRARRKALCETCLKFAVAILVFSAFLGFAA